MWFLRTFGGSIVGVFLFWTLYLLNLWLDFIPKWEPYDYSYESYSTYPSDSYSDSSYSDSSYSDPSATPSDSYSTDPYGTSSGSTDPYGTTTDSYTSPYGSDPYASPPYDGSKTEELYPSDDPDMAPDAPLGLPTSSIREQLALLDTDIAEDLSGNIYKITVRSLVFNSDLSPISQASALEELTLEQPQYIDDEGLRYLSGLTNLRSLSLRNATVTDAGLYHLEGLTNLTTLDLTGTQVTFVGVDRLRSVLPSCTVIY